MAITERSYIQAYIENGCSLLGDKDRQVPGKYHSEAIRTAISSDSLEDLGNPQGAS